MTEPEPADAKDATRWTELDDTILFAAGLVTVAILGTALHLAASSFAHVAPLYVVVFLAGAIGGPWFGLAAGGTSLGAFYAIDATFGWHLAAPLVAMSLVGGLAGILARLRFVRWAKPAAVAGFAALAAFGLTVMFSMTTSVLEWVLAALAIAPTAHGMALGAIVTQAVGFVLLTGLLNALAAGAAAPVLVLGLRRLEQTQEAGEPVAALMQRVDALAWEGAVSPIEETLGLEDAGL